MTNKTPYEAGPDTSHRLRPSRVLRRIQAGKVARVLKMNTTDPVVAEIFGQSGIDAIWICMEHVHLGFADAANLVRAAKITDTDTLVRVSRGGYADYIRALEIDATGLIVPHVMDAADAARVRDMTKFPPLGRRAVDGGNADGCYTRAGFLDYLGAANDERLVLHQIEDPSAVEDLEAIAALPGVDGLFFGPGDYSVALGIPGRIWDAEVDSVRRRVAEVARRHDKIAATVCGNDKIGALAGMGYNLLSVGADVVALAQYSDNAISAFADL